LIPGVHLEGMRGNIKQNERYCKKFSTLMFFGEPFVEPGQRKDVQAVYNMVKEGKTDLEIMELNFANYARFQRAIGRLRTLLKPKREGYPNVILIYGPPGCGKTKEAFTQHPDLWEPPITTSKKESTWFDGYVGQKVVLLDEFEGHLPLNSLLKLIDKYVRQVPVKGGFTWFNPDTIILTCNEHPSKWYSYGDRVQKEIALRRRICEVFEYKEGYIDEIEGRQDWIFHDNHLQEGDQATEAMKKFWPIEWNDKM